ncbi:hypothetical protein [Carnobacterium maltaromaticum]|uniref:hypothetical protein n=1 Tax=Carnobacterium maltaromaticum TaxID=2751 RepID=UPI0039AFC756
MENYSKIMYKNNQFYGKKLVLISKIFYEVKIDYVHSRYFVVNMNNEIIYLDYFSEEAIVKTSEDNIELVNFSILKLTIEYD